MTNKLIEPKILKGFRDYLPELMIHRKRMINKIRFIKSSPEKLCKKKPIKLPL